MGAKQHPAHLHGLVDIAHVLRLHVGVLLPTAHQLGKGGQQALNADAAHVHILPRHQGCSGREGDETVVRTLQREGNAVCRWHRPAPDKMRLLSTHRCNTMLQQRAKELDAATSCRQQSVQLAFMCHCGSRAAREGVDVPRPAIRLRKAAKVAPNSRPSCCQNCCRRQGGRRCPIALQEQVAAGLAICSWPHVAWLKHGHTGRDTSALVKCSTGAEAGNGKLGCMPHRC